MTKDEAKKLKKAAFLYGESQYAAGTGSPEVEETDRLWLALTALIDRKVSSTMEFEFMDNKINATGAQVVNLSVTKDIEALEVVVCAREAASA